MNHNCILNTVSIVLRILIVINNCTSEQIFLFSRFQFIELYLAFYILVLCLLCLSIYVYVASVCLSQSKREGEREKCETEN